jgi:hypothetical protein
MGDVQVEGVRRLARQFFLWCLGGVWLEETGRGHVSRISTVPQMSRISIALEDVWLFAFRWLLVDALRNALLAVPFSAL